MNTIRCSCDSTNLSSDMLQCCNKSIKLGVTSVMRSQIHDYLPFLHLGILGKLFLWRMKVLLLSTVKIQLSQGRTKVSYYIQYTVLHEKDCYFFRFPSAIILLPPSFNGFMPYAIVLFMYHFP